MYKRIEPRLVFIRVGSEKIFGIKEPDAPYLKSYRRITKFCLARVTDMKYFEAKQKIMTHEKKGFW